MSWVKPSVLSLILNCEKTYIQTQALIHNSTGLISVVKSLEKLQSQDKIMCLGLTMTLNISVPQL